MLKGYNCWPIPDKSKPGWGLPGPGLPVGTLLYLLEIYFLQGGWGLERGTTVNHIMILETDYRLKNEKDIWAGCHKYLVLATMKETGQQIKIPWKIYEPWTKDLYTVLFSE